MLPTCRVHCAVFDNDGSPIAGAVVTARLDRFEVVPDGYVVPDLETATTDAAGACVLPLWPNALGNTASFYNIKIQAPNGKSLRLTAVVPDVPDIDLQQIAALPPYEGKPDGQIILDQAIAASLETFAARDRAELAAEYVQPVYDYLPHTQTVSESIDAVSTVAAHIDNVDVVAEHIDSVDTVAERAQAVDTVAGRIQDVMDVAAIDAAVAQVAANLADVSNFGLVYQGARATDPSTRADGSPLQDGDLYFNTVSRRMRAYATGVWEDYEAQAAAAAPVQSVFGRTGTVTLQSADVTGALGFTPLDAAQKSAANGIAPLGADSKVPASYLPSYVDDVLEYANTTGFPAIGETAKIYVALDTNKTYRWSGSAYVEISPSPGTTDSLTEGATNLYFTTARARAALSAIGAVSYNSATGVISAELTSGYASKTISANTTLNADTEYETGRNLRVNHGVKLTVPSTTLLIVRKYAAGSSL